MALVWETDNRHILVNSRRRGTLLLEWRGTGEIGKAPDEVQFHQDFETWIGKNQEGVLGRGDSTIKARWGRVLMHNEVGHTAAGQGTQGLGG